MTNTEIPTAKTCSKCGQAKPLDHYPKRKGMPDGHRGVCNACQAIESHNRFAANKQRLVERSVPATKRCMTCQEEKPVSQFKPHANCKDGHTNQCDSCRAQDSARYYLSTRERQLAQQRAYYQAHPDIRHAIIVASHKRYYQGHKEEYKAYSKQWLRDHPGWAYRQAKKWQAAHPEQAKRIRSDSRRRRRAHLAQVAVERFTILEIAERDNWRCHICGRPVPHDDPTLDHLIPLSKGGPHTTWNVALAHRSCNCRRGAGRTPAQLRLPL